MRSRTLTSFGRDGAEYRSLRMVAGCDVSYLLNSVMVNQERSQPCLHCAQLAGTVQYMQKMEQLFPRKRSKETDGLFFAGELTLSIFTIKKYTAFSLPLMSMYATSITSWKYNYMFSRGCYYSSIMYHSQFRVCSHTVVYKYIASHTHTLCVEGPSADPLFTQPRVMPTCSETNEAREASAKSEYLTSQ